MEKDSLRELMKAVNNSELPSIQKLLSDGTDVNGHCDNENNSVLHYASNLEVVKELLKHRANVNVQNKYGETPLETFVRKYHSPELVEALLKHGANVNVVNCRGNTPLNVLIPLSRYNGTNYPVFQLLLSYGANVFLKNRDMYSPYDNALRFNCAEYLTKLFSVHAVKSFLCPISINDYRKKFVNILKLNGYTRGQEVYNCVWNHLNRCIPEIVAMKNDMRLGATSVFDFINEKDINMIYLHFSNKHIEKVRNEINSEYSVYQELIMSKIDKCIKSRETILPKVHNLCFFTLVVDCKQRIVLNSYCTSIIFEYLSNIDAQNVFEVFHNLDTEKSEKLNDMKENITNSNALPEVSDDNICTFPSESSVTESACKRIKVV